MHKSPFNNTHLQSELAAAGVSFDFNKVDTVCNRKLGLGFYCVLLLLVVLLTFPHAIGHSLFAMVLPSARATGTIESSMGDMPAGFVGHPALTSNYLYVGLLCLLSMYLVLYVLRLAYYLRIRSKLRKDIAPLTVEAYAVVKLDIKHKLSDYVLSWLFGSERLGLMRYAVLYKEVGTTKPRYFLTAAVSCNKLCFIPEHIGRVFIDRKNAKLYTLDDHSAYQTISARRRPAMQMLSPHAFSLNAQENGHSSSEAKEES